MPSRLYQLLLNLLLPCALVYWVKQFFKHQVPWAYFKERLGFLPHLPQEAIWIHAASIGELGVAKKIIATLKTSHPVILSCSTSKGLVRQETDFFLPFDHKWIIQHTYKTLKPKALILIEREIWPNLIQSATCPVYLINARLSAKSFKWYSYTKSLMKQTLKQLSGVWCNGSKDAERLKALGANITCVHPNIKYLPSTLKTFEKSYHHHKTFVFSCTHPGEEIILQPIFKALLAQNPTNHMIIIPRHPHRASSIIKALGPSNDERIIVETRFGCTSEWYAQATAVFMGGSFVPHGGQNPLEPLQYNCPSFIGPYYHNFTEVVEALEQANLITITPSPQTLLNCLENPLQQPDPKYFLEQQQQRVENALQLLQSELSKSLDNHVQQVDLETQEN